MLRRFAFFELAVCLHAQAAQTIVQPAWHCDPDAIFIASFEIGESVPNSPTLGSGGAYPGNVTRQIDVSPSFPNRTYYVYTPSNYSPAHPMPLLLALHASAGDPQTAETFAASVVLSWQNTAEANGFIVAAPASTSDNGVWGTAPGDDDTEIADVLADMQTHYNVDLDRYYIWGFSAGGNYANALALSDPSNVAAYAVNAGVLGAYSPLVASAASVRVVPLSADVGVNDPLLAEMQHDEQVFLDHGWILGNTLLFTEFSDGTPPGGHTYTSAQLAAHWAFMCPYLVAP